MLPADRNLLWRNVFVQDEYTLIPGWRLTMGVKAEENPYTGWEALPSLHLAWSSAASSLWRASGDPDFGASVRMSYRPSEHLHLDAMFRHVGDLEGMDVPAYEALDVKLAWQLRPELGVSLMGQNLLDSGHAEFGAPPNQHLYERSFYGQRVWNH